MQTIFDLGYRAWWHTGRLFNPDNHNKCSENVFGNRCNTNVLCLPRERGDSDIPKGLIECENAQHTIMQDDGRIIVSIADWEPRLELYYSTMSFG